MVDFTNKNTNDSFKSKEDIRGQRGNNCTKNNETIVSLKYLSIFWRTLEMLLINCEVNFILNW